MPVEKFKAGGVVVLVSQHDNKALPTHLGHLWLTHTGSNGNADKGICGKPWLSSEVVKPRIYVLNARRPLETHRGGDSQSCRPLWAEWAT